MLAPGVLVFYWPEWLVAVFDLLCLTRRSWTYLRLYTARFAGTGWARRLGDLVYNAPTLRYWLLEELADLESLAYDLQDAYDSSTPGAPADQLEQLLQMVGGILGPALPAGTPCAARAGSVGPAAIFNRTWPSTSIHPDLLAALTDLQKLLNNKGHVVVGLAWVELCEGVGGPVTPAPPQSNIENVLTAIRARRRDVRAPGAALKAIGSVTPTTTGPDSEGVLPLPGLYLGLINGAVPWSGHTWDLLQHVLDLLLQNYDFDDIPRPGSRTDDIRRSLAIDGPYPSYLDDRLLELVRQRLKFWLHLVLRSATVPGLPLREIPIALSKSTVLSEAIKIVRKWQKSPKSKPKTWMWTKPPALTAEAEAIVAAVTCSCIGILSYAMIRSYEEHAVD